MNEPLESLYFNWLCAQVGPNRIGGKLTPSLTYWELLKILHKTEFVWLLSGDDNRAMDGVELRYEFLMMADIPDNPEWREESGCSMLEMFVAFAKRASFQTDDPTRDWFWEFMDNLGLKDFTDATNPTYEQVDEILDPLIWRTYNQDGHGGIFPIDNPKSDQRKTEIWYQFCEYLVDKDRLP